MRHVPATRFATQMSTCIINKAMVCQVSAASVVAVVSVRVPVVTPHTAGILKPTSWAWYYCSLQFLLPWSSRVGSEWEPWGDHRGDKRYTVDWDLTKSDMGAAIESASGHQRWSATAVKWALNRCWEEMGLTLVRERKGETWNEATVC